MVIGLRKVQTKNITGLLPYSCVIVIVIAYSRKILVVGLGEIPLKKQLDEAAFLVFTSLQPLYWQLVFAHATY